MATTTTTDLQRSDTTKGPPLRILSLDGGGVRGYSMFIIIQEIMHRTFVEIEGRAPRRHEIPKPADHFDLIVGTGTGGLIALMLGRLRLDLETCKALYVRLTRKVFETDKTILGIPTRPTLFKASKLEEAIKEAVAEHTRSENEGNDGAAESGFTPMSPGGARNSGSGGALRRRLSRNDSVVSFSGRSPTVQTARLSYSGFGGDPNAMLYDEREERAKTAVTAVYKGATAKAPAVLLRSYDSKKEAAVEAECKIWEAGRATCSIGLAFKAIRIGQSVFHDDAEGRFNPSPEALDEAVVNEWPGREVGVFLSIGTGKRPPSTIPNHSEWYEGFLGEYAEAKRRLISKIEGCEKTHDRVKNELLSKRGVNVENYYRLNVEVGVGEFGMNEWHRLSDISTSTRMYLGRKTEQKMVQDASTKMAKIHLARRRLVRLENVPEIVQSKPEIHSPLAAELPAEIPGSWPTQPVTPEGRRSYDSGAERLSTGTAQTPSPRASYEQAHKYHTAPQQRPAPVTSTISPPRTHRTPPGNGPSRPPPSAPSAVASTAANAGRKSSGNVPTQAHVASSGAEDDRLLILAPTPSQYRHASGSDKIAITSGDERSSHSHTAQGAPPQLQHLQQSAVINSANRQQQQQQQQHQSRPHRVEPPPLPPKTPLPEQQQQQHTGPGRRMGENPKSNGLVPLPLSIDQATSGAAPPYPMDDEAPPPPVNMAGKPRYTGR